MNRWIAIFGLALLSPLIGAADSRSDLEQARAHYQQAVSRHGEKSPEARNARQNLRSARRNFHDERRQKRQPANDPRR